MYEQLVINLVIFHWRYLPSPLLFLCGVPSSPHFSIMTFQSSKHQTCLFSCLQASCTVVLPVSNRKVLLFPCGPDPPLVPPCSVNLICTCNCTWAEWHINPLTSPAPPHWLHHQVELILSLKSVLDLLPPSLAYFKTSPTPLWKLSYPPNYWN